MIRDLLPQLFDLHLLVSDLCPQLIDLSLKHLSHGIKLFLDQRRNFFLELTPDFHLLVTALDLHGRLALPRPVLNGGVLISDVANEEALGVGLVSHRFPRTVGD